MKKIIVTAGLAFFALGLFAQGSDQLISKKGEMYLPEAGDWSVSFSADPFLDYFGNFLSSKGNVAPVLGFPDATSSTIIGKYYVDPQTAYRVLFRIGINSMTQANFVEQDGSTSNPVGTVTDNATYAQHFIGLGAGYEKRRGKTRLQGYYGGEFMFYLAGNSNTYTYGNEFTSTYQAPYCTQWGGPYGVTVQNPGNGTQETSRTLSVSPGATFGISLQGFIGFEYFFMPKVSVGGEYTWGINFSSTAQGTTQTEVWNLSNNASQTNTTNTGASSSFSLDDGLNTIWGNSAGDLYICFHF